MREEYTNENGSRMALQKLFGRFSGARRRVPGTLGPSWSVLKSSWGGLGRSSGVLGALLGSCSAPRGVFWRALGRSWRALGRSWPLRRRFLEAL